MTHRVPITGTLTHADGSVVPRCCIVSSMIATFGGAALTIQLGHRARGVAIPLLYCLMAVPIAVGCECFPLLELAIHTIGVGRRFVAGQIPVGAHSFDPQPHPAWGVGYHQVRGPASLTSTTLLDLLGGHLPDTEGVLPVIALGAISAALMPPRHIVFSSLYPTGIDIQRPSAIPQHIAGDTLLPERFPCQDPVLAGGFQGAAPTLPLFGIVPDLVNRLTHILTFREATSIVMGNYVSDFKASVFYRCSCPVRCTR